MSFYQTHIDTELYPEHQIEIYDVTQRQPLKSHRLTRKISCVAYPVIKFAQLFWIHVLYNIRYSTCIVSNHVKIFANPSL